MIKLGVYWTLGDYGHNVTLDVLQALVDQNVALLELGLPFSDPLLDGPLIQQSHHRVTASGFGYDDAMVILQQIKEYIVQSRKKFDHSKNKQVEQTQISVMTASQLVYLPDARAKLPKVDGILVTDIASGKVTPFELPSPRVWFVSQEVVLDPQFCGLPAENISMIYLTRLKGITGAGQRSADDTASAIQKLKQFTDKPIWLGFGVTTASDLQECERQGAHGAVVGSAFIKAMNASFSLKISAKEAVSQWLEGMKY